MNEVIEGIDNRLEQPGIEEISYREVASKLNGDNKNSTYIIFCDYLFSCI